MMGLFSRKASSYERQDDWNTRNAQLLPNSDGALKTTFGMKRASSNQAETVNLPSVPLPKAPDPHLDPAGYLRSIYAVRERSRLVLEKAKANQLRHFDVDISKFEDTAKFVVSIIKVIHLPTKANFRFYG